MAEIYKPLGQLSDRDRVINAIGRLTVHTVFLKRDLSRFPIANSRHVINLMKCVKSAGTERVTKPFKSGDERLWELMFNPRERKSGPKRCRVADCTLAANRHPCPIYLEAGGTPVEKERIKRKNKPRRPDGLS
jgi:hypothetical protein